MKIKIFLKLVFACTLTLFCNCKAQDVQRYTKQYNTNTPKLQTLAKIKKQYYGKEFSSFMHALDKENLQVVYFMYLPKMASRPENYQIVLNFTSIEDIDLSQKNKLQRPFIIITMQEPIPNEIRALTRKYEGRLSPEVREFLGNQKIEKIDFYGINGLTNKDRTSR